MKLLSVLLCLFFMLPAWAANFDQKIQARILQQNKAKTLKAQIYSSKNMTKKQKKYFYREFRNLGIKRLPKMKYDSKTRTFHFSFDRKKHSFQFKDIALGIVKYKGVEIRTRASWTPDQFVKNVTRQLNAKYGKTTSYLQILFGSSVAFAGIWDFAAKIIGHTSYDAGVVGGIHGMAEQLSTSTLKYRMKISCDTGKYTVKLRAEGYDDDGDKVQITRVVGVVVPENYRPSVEGEFPEISNKNIHRDTWLEFPEEPRKGARIIRGRKGYRLLGYKMEGSQPDIRDYDTSIGSFSKFKNSNHSVEEDFKRVRGVRDQITPQKFIPHIKKCCDPIHFSDAGEKEKVKQCEDGVNNDEVYGNYNSIAPAGSGPSGEVE